MEKLQLILSHFHCCLTVDGGCSLIIYDDLVMIILEYEGCYLQMYDLERTTIRLKKLLEDTKISWQRLNIIGTIERLERKQASFFGFCIPPGTLPNSSSEEITANGTLMYFFQRSWKKHKTEYMTYIHLMFFQRSWENKTVSLTYENKKASLDFILLFSVS